MSESNGALGTELLDQECEKLAAVLVLELAAVSLGGPERDVLLHELAEPPGDRVAFSKRFEPNDSSLRQLTKRVAVLGLLYETGHAPDGRAIHARVFIVAQAKRQQRARIAESHEPAADTVLGLDRRRKPSEDLRAGG